MLPTAKLAVGLRSIEIINPNNTNNNESKQKYSKGAKIMPGDEKEKKRVYVVEVDKEGECPKKEGDNCLVPGGFSDSEPIGGA